MLDRFGKSRSGSSVERFAAHVRAEGAVQELPIDGTSVLALQLPFLTISESMGNHDSKIVDADSVD
jgi:hypothetical protein